MPFSWSICSSVFLDTTELSTPVSKYDGPGVMQQPILEEPGDEVHISVCKIWTLNPFATDLTRLESKESLGSATADKVCS